MPFLKGYRSCPAQKLPYPMMLVPLVRLLWSFDFKPVSNLGGGAVRRHDSPRGEGVFQLKDQCTSSAQRPLLVFEDRRQ